MRCGLAAALVLAVAGCASSDPTYYTLQPVPGTALAGGTASIEVASPAWRGISTAPMWWLKSADYRLAVNSQARWAEPLGDMIGRVLTQDLSQRLPGSSVFMQSGAISADPQMRVEVDILGFDADASGTVVLTAELAVERGTTHAPLATRHVVLSAQPAGPGAGNLAAAMSGLLGGLAEQVAQDVRRATAGI